MLYGAHQYLLLFLPVVFFIYFYVLRNQSIKVHLAFLIVSSFVFVCSSGWFNGVWLGLSLIVNNIFAKKIAQNKSKALAITAILFNISYLGFFKYSGFIENIFFNIPYDQKSASQQIPLGISFYTFQNITYVWSLVANKMSRHNPLEYSFYLSFFAQLVSGPIVRFSEIVDQIRNKALTMVNYQNVYQGILLFSIGLIKKQFADYIQPMTVVSFQQQADLHFSTFWLTSLAYAFFIYFDFSSYIDLARGSALFFNIKLPINFDSPYKACNPSDFWRRWNITLSQFLRDFVYVPLGGSRVSLPRTTLNLLITMFIAGLWHGASYNFILWGVIHGLYLVIHRLLTKFGLSVPNHIGITMTFIAIVFAWVPFKFETLAQTLTAWEYMIGMHGIDLPVTYGINQFLMPLLDGTTVYSRLFYESQAINTKLQAAILCATLIMVFSFRNSQQMIEKVKPSYKLATICAFILVIHVCSNNNVKDFVYFQF